LTSRSSAKEAPMKDQKQGKPQNEQKDWMLETKSWMRRLQLVE
jgi:hypothetical protein